jgi:hypothetical protein
MQRVSLFELQDLGASPKSLGHAGTACLRVLEEAFGIPALLRPIVDLCSGAGGPMPAIVAPLDIPLTLSDRIPDNTALAAAAATCPGAVVHPQPVDAAAVPEELSGLRTILNAFHHFDDEVALSGMADAAAAGQPLLVIEISERTLANVVGSAIIPLLVLAMMPRVRPIRPEWLVLTYLLPILPLTIAWDGLVSHLRTLIKQIDAIDAPGWRWQAERTPLSGPAAATWMLGLPPEQR